MSASITYDSPVETVRELRQIRRTAAIATVLLFSIVAALIVNGALSADRAILIGISAFAGAWAAAIIANAAPASPRAQATSLLVGALATTVAVLTATATLTNDARGRTVLASLTILIALFIWFHSVMTAGSKASFEISAGALALLAAALGLITIPTQFDTRIGSDAGGLLVAAIAPLAAALLIVRHTRRALIVAALIGLIFGILIREPAESTIWVIAGALLVLLFISDRSAAVLPDRATISFSSLDAVLLIGAAAFLSTYLAFSMDKPVRGLLMGSLGVTVVAASLVLRLVITERDERMAELAQLTAEIRERSRLDSLTELPNRAALDARLDEEVERAVRYRHPLSVCFIDIDHFKAINDTRGHSVGDTILREVASVIRATIRTPDFVARYGGEEFVVIAPGTWTEDAAVLGSRIQAAIAEKVQRPMGDAVTVSIGIAGVPEHGRDISTILKVADSALYAAKRAGRNRVEIGFADIPLSSP